MALWHWRVVTDKWQVVGSTCIHKSGATQADKNSFVNDACLQYLYMYWWGPVVQNGLAVYCRGIGILANRPDLVGTVPIWRPKPDVPPDDPKKPIRPDLSRSKPKTRFLNPLFACSLCSSVGIQVSSVSFGHFSCTRPWQAVSQTKKICIIGHSSCSFSCNFPLSARNCVHFRPIFSCSKCVESLTKTLKMRISQSRFSKFSGGAYPRTP